MKFLGVFKMYLKILITYTMLSMAKCARPGVFFWKPRLALDLAIPTTQGMGGNSVVFAPTKDNIAQGLVVLINGYTAGMTVISLASGLTSGTAYPSLDLRAAAFYNNVYRWGLRYISLIPQWLGGNSGHFVQTHKTWKRRFYYMDAFMPPWLQKMIPYVKQEDWDKEYLDWRRYKKYAESAFGKHYRYPTKKFTGFHSFQTKETAEVNYQEVSSESI